MTGVVLTDGWEVAADLVVVGVGIAPDLSWPRRPGWRSTTASSPTNCCAPRIRTIYACGDVASSFNPLLGPADRVEHWANALNGGPAAARSMLGSTEPYARVPYFFSDQYDLGMEYTGWVDAGRLRPGGLPR